MKLTLIDRYIIKTFIPYFLFSMGVLLSLSLSIGVLFEYIRRIVSEQISIFLAVKLLLLKLPEFIVLTASLAVLLATLLTYQQLSKKNEITALFGLGISRLRLLFPALLIGVTITLIIFIFNENIVPKTNYLAAIKLEKQFNIIRQPYQTKDIFYQEYNQHKDSDTNTNSSLKYLFIAESFNGQTMNDVIVINFVEGNSKNKPQITFAQEAEWNSQQQKWQVRKGTNINTVINDINPFQKSDLFIPQNPINFANQNLQNIEMNLLQSWQKLKLIENSNDFHNLQKLKIHIHEKFAIPLSCLIFSILGGILGIDTLKVKNNYLGFSFGIIIIFFMLRLIGYALSLLNIFPVFLGAWLGNLMMGILLIFLLIVKKV